MCIRDRICALRAALVEKSMNDEMKGKSGKVKVMYVRSDDDSDKMCIRDSLFSQHCKTFPRLMPLLVW